MRIEHANCFFRVSLQVRAAFLKNRSDVREGNTCWLYSIDISQAHVGPSTQELVNKER